MSRDAKRKLEAEVKRIIDQAQAHLLQHNNTAANNRWSQICHETDTAKKKIIQKIDALWPDHSES